MVNPQHTTFKKSKTETRLDLVYQETSALFFTCSYYTLGLKWVSTYIYYYLKGLHKAKEKTLN